MKLIVLFIYVYVSRCRDVWFCSCNAASHNVDISFSCASKRWFTKLVVKSECLCLSAAANAQYLKLDFSMLLFDKFLYYNFLHFENKKIFLRQNHFDIWCRETFELLIMKFFEEFQRGFFDFDYHHSKYVFFFALKGIFLTLDKHLDS